jgi:hypothetical protein
MDGTIEKMEWNYRIKEYKRQVTTERHRVMKVRNMECIIVVMCIEAVICLSGQAILMGIILPYL